MQELTKFFRRASFRLAAGRRSQLPEDVGFEVAFAGRSNAGKSTAINVLCDQNGLARTSKTPGRTQQLVVFDLDEDHRLIDLPGYGYAKVPAAMRSEWRDLVDGFLRERQCLTGLVLLSDVRQALTDFDRQMLAWCDSRQLPCLLLLTKADKLNRGPAASQLQKIRHELTTGFGTEINVQLFSSLHKQGLESAREWIGTALGVEPG